MANIQIIRDKSGNAEYAIVPWDEYQKLVYFNDSHEQYESISYAADSDDDHTVPHEVVSIMVDQSTSLLAAWRIYRGLSQYEVADKLGTTQSAVSQWEAVDSKPQKKTREKLAILYGCHPEQMIL